MIKLLALNIEGDKHLDRVRPFIERENLDVVCLQEVFRVDVESIVPREMHVEFLPMCLKVRLDNSLAEWGVALATKTTPQRVRSEYYFKPSPDLQLCDDSSVDAKRRTYRQGVLGAELEDDGQLITLFTTHFTWTPNGFSNHNQATDIEQLLHLMSSYKPHILCGDFNIPRIQNSMYPIIAAAYTDHVPPHYETSMFLPLHRVKDDPIEGPRVSSFMVDYIFSTPNSYLVENVTMHGGVSDHCALVASIACTKK